MNKRNRISIISIFSVIIILACNINIEGATQAPNLELTITAQALLLQQASQTSIPAVVVETETSIVVVESTATIGGSGAIVDSTATLTSSTITVSVSAETNCRTGPGVSFASVYSLPIGQVAEVIGKNTITNYWIIKIPGSGSGGTCWLWGTYATVSGDTSGLVEFATPTPLPTAVVVKPNAPSNLNFVPNCQDQGSAMFIYAGTLTWKDNSNNETGFNVYLSGPENKTYSLAANTKSLVLSNLYPEANAVVLVVEAFNSAGASQSSSIIFTCS